MSNRVGVVAGLSIGAKAVFKSKYFVNGSVIRKPMKKRNSYRVGSLVKPKGAKVKNWNPKDRILRVETRKKLGRWSPSFKYFVVSVNHKAGVGQWLYHHELEPLTALEQLAAQA